MHAAALREKRQGSYETVRPDVQALVPRDAGRILDLGCAAGHLGAALKARQDAEVVGIELLPDYASDAAEQLDRVICADVATALADPDADLGMFDCIVAADVLEHLLDPWTVLRRAVERLQPGGTVIVSVPNVRYLLVPWTLLRRGRWPRDASGLFDATHLRWFTPRDARDLLAQADLDVIAEAPQYWFSGWPARLVAVLGRTPLREFLAGQYVLLGRKSA